MNYETVCAAVGRALAAGCYSAVDIDQAMSRCIQEGYSITGPALENALNAGRRSQRAAEPAPNTMAAVARRARARLNGEVP